MSAITLTATIARCRQKANMEATQFVTDAEITTLINVGIQEFHDVIADACPDLLAKVSADFTMTSSSLTLSSSVTDFYRVLGLDYKCGGSGTGYVNVRPWSMAHRNSTVERSYKIIGGATTTLYVYPPELAPGTYRLWYVPTTTLLSSGSDTWEDFNGWGEFVVADVAAKLLVKEESDPSPLMADRERYRQRIMDAARRMLDHAPVVQNVTSPWFQGY
jgi:hypothetical protein